MEEIVNVVRGVKYGFKLLVYVAIVLLLGSLVSLFGLGVMFTAIGSPTSVTAVTTGVAGDLNLIQFVIGGFIFLLGTTVKLTGLIGGVYKLVADAAYYAQIKSHGRRA